MPTVHVRHIRPLDRELLAEIDAFRVAMVATRSATGLHSQPMLLARRSGPELWFPVRLDDPRVRDLRDHPRCCASFQGTLTFLSVSGRASIVRSRELVQKTWSDAWAAFFPGGIDDPEIAMLHITITEGQVWDLSGLRGVRAALRVVGSAVSRGLEERLPDSEVQEL